MATVAEALGQDVPEHAAPDSRSVRQCLVGDALESPLHDVLVSQSSRGRFAIRHGRWKLICGGGSGGWTPPASDAAARDAGLPSMQLYDLAADPGETTNLIAVHPDRVDRMIRLFRACVEAAPNDGPVYWSQLPWDRSTR